MTIATGIDGKPRFNRSPGSLDSNNPTIVADHDPLGISSIQHCRTRPSCARDKDAVEARTKSLKAKPLRAPIAAERLIFQLCSGVDPMPGMPWKSRRSDIVTDPKFVE